MKGNVEVLYSKLLGLKADIDSSDHLVKSFEQYPKSYGTPILAAFGKNFIGWSPK